MSRKIEVTASEFASVMGCLFDPCSTAIRGEPGAIPPDPEACQHWIETAYVVLAADLMIAKALNRKELEEDLERAGAGSGGGVGSMMQAFIDDFCGTPPRWPRGWPRRKPFKRDSLSAVQLLAAGARMQAAFDQLGQPELEEAADRFFDEGFSRLGERGAR
jgi:hypothetical protein